MQTLLPSAIRAQLASARRKLRAVDASLGLARAILFLASALVLLFTLDISLQPPVSVLRTFALFVAVVAAAGAAVVLTKPLRRRLSDDDVAILVEDELPQLEGGLVSSVQLSRELQRSDLYTSRALIQATIDRTAERVVPLDFGAVVRTGPMVPLWVLIAAFLGMGVMLLGNPTVADYAAVFYRRVAYGERVPYPKLVQLRVAMPAVIQVAKGEDLVVRAFVDQGADLVQRLTVNTRFEGSSDVERREMVQKSTVREERVEEVFEKTYQNVTDPFSFYVEAPAHGVESQPYRVEVVTRPRVEDYDFVLGYPAYIGKAQETVRQPDLHVPAGTTITYAVLSNKPLAAAPEGARLLVADEGRAAREALERGEEAAVAEGPAPLLLGDVDPAALQPGGAWASLAPSVARLREAAGEAVDSRLLLGQLTVSDDLAFQFDLQSQEGLGSGQRAVKFTVQVAEDRRPVVMIPTPGRRKQVTPQARVPLEIVARDDYGLAEVILRVAPQTGDAAEAPTPNDFARVNLAALEANAKEARLEHVLDVADSRLQPGDRLHYYAVAFDHNLDEAKRSKESRQYELTVVRPEDLERILQDRLTALKERLKGVAKDQADAKQATEAFVAALAPKGILTEDDRRSLQRLSQDQRRVTTRLEDVRQEFELLAAEREQNRLTEAAAMELLRELSEGTRDLHERASPLVTRELEDGRAAPDLTAEIRTRLGRVPDLQDEIERSILALAARIDKWGDFTEVLQEVRDLLRGEDRIYEGTRRAAQTEHR